MFPRIILVGMVAALGITVPTRPEVLGWVHAVHNWTTGLRAMMDGGRPFASEMETETEAGTVAGWPLEASAHETASTVAPAAKEPAVPTGSPTWTPIPVEEQVGGLAHELNRRSEGLDLHALPPAPRQAAVAAGSRRGKDAGLERIVRTLLDRDLIDELTGIGRDGASDGPKVGVADPVRRVRSARMVLVCTLGRAPTSTTVPRGIVAVPAARPATPARIEPIAPVEEKEIDLAVALNRFGESVDPAHPATWASAVASAPARIVPVEAPDTGLAGELNRVAEGLAHAAIGPPGDEPTGREVGVPRAPAARALIGVGQAGADETPTVGDALRLTREAARAWVDVLRKSGGGESAVRVSAR